MQNEAHVFKATIYTKLCNREFNKQKSQKLQWSYNPTSNIWKELNFEAIPVKFVFENSKKLKEIIDEEFIKQLKIQLQFEIYKWTFIRQYFSLPSGNNEAIKDVRLRSKLEKLIENKLIDSTYKTAKLCFEFTAVVHKYTYNFKRNLLTTLLLGAIITSLPNMCFNDMSPVILKASHKLFKLFFGTSFGILSNCILHCCSNIIFASRNGFPLHIDQIDDKYFENGYSKDANARHYDDLQCDPWEPSSKICFISIITSFLVGSICNFPIGVLSASAALFAYDFMPTQHRIITVVFDDLNSFKSSAPSSGVGTNKNINCIRRVR